MTDLARRLNPAQHAAVTATDGAVLVIAGAGSGKTRVIEYRVLHLVQTGIDPRSILLLTFTKRAAREMLSRASRHDPRCQYVDGGTFHSFCYRVLKRHAAAIGLQHSFTVLDEADAEEAIHKCCTKLGFYDRQKRFPKKGTLRAILSIAVNKDMPVREALRREYPHFVAYTPDIERLRTLYAEYKLDKNFVDYDDLLVFCKLLLEDEDIRQKISRKFRYIMVDEYQDTNALQGGITYLLGRDHRNVMVVGDDAQSIYGFRGATHENIMKFPRLFPEATIMKLEDNYRSSQAVLDVANAALENMKSKYSKCLVSAQKIAGEKPYLAYFKNAYDEAEWIAGKIKQYNDEGIDINHQAVLFRNLYISIPLQAALGKRGIPFHVFGGLRFYETAHAKDIIAHLKILANPQDELSWNRVLTLLEGIGPKKAERLSEEILGSSSFDAIIEVLSEKSKETSRSSAGIAKLKHTLKKALKARRNIGEQFGVIVDYYNPLLHRKFDDWHLRANDLDTLQQIAARYATIDELLADFAIEPPERGVRRVEGTAAQDEKPLTLSTIHSAKGLEWDVVFLMGVMEGVLPSRFAVHDEEEAEEEHRLFYVALTRAKRHLFLSMHHEGRQGGINQFNRLSRFVETANVLSKLDHPDLEGVLGDIDSDIDSILDHEMDQTAPIHNKQWLLKRVKDSYR